MSCRELRPLFAAFLSVAAVALVACGPTANAIRPTLPPRTLQPAASAPVIDSSSGTGLQSVAPAASGTPPPGGVATQISGFPQGSAYEVTGVAVTPAGYVAVGFAGTGQGYFGLHQGVVWRSADGINWQQTVDPAFLDVSPTYVVAVADTVYVFGQFSTCAEAIDTECTDDPNAGTVVFRSMSGAPWEQLAQTSDIIGASFDGVTAWGNTLVAWGAAGDDNGTSTVWTSADGLNWTPTTDLAGLDPVDSVAAGGPGLIAFGAKFDASIEDTQLVAATSTDGIQFTSATVPAITGASVMSVAAGPSGYAGAGWAASDSEPSLGLTLSSADGTNWSQTTATDGSFDNTLMNDLHATSSGYVAVGSAIDETDMTLQTGRIWLSADGTSWHSPGNFGGLFSQYGDSALGPGGLVVFTADEQDSNDEGTDVNSTIYGWLVPHDRLTP